MTLAPPLLDWFHAHKRPLAWRSDVRDPYAVWVSEVMLQQTTVAAATGYFTRWMQRFPNVAELAVQHPNTVLKYWEGLGYYARARNLHKGAQFVVEKYGGVLPRTVPELLAIPGIGRYTAGAIASLAFNEPAPIVDANVARVLCRVFLLEGDPKTDRKTQAALWQHAAELIPDGSAGAFNEALMELGALVCVPKEPKCEQCPLASQCAASQSGRVGEFPQFAPKKVLARETHIAVAIVDEYWNVTLVQRPLSSALWGGLWELPRVVRVEPESLDAAGKRAALETTGLRVDKIGYFGFLEHIVAQRRITLHGLTARHPNPQDAMPTEKGAAVVRVSLADVEQYALSTPQRKLLKQLGRHLSQTRLEL